jgi:hypothetical protein
VLAKAYAVGQFKFNLHGEKMLKKFIYLSAVMALTTLTVQANETAPETSEKKIEENVPALLARNTPSFKRKKHKKVKEESQMVSMEDESSSKIQAPDVEQLLAHESQEDKKPTADESSNEDLLAHNEQIKNEKPVSEEENLLVHHDGDHDNEDENKDNSEKKLIA